jgi:hypothetical protein
MTLAGHKSSLGAGGSMLERKITRLSRRLAAVPLLVLLTAARTSVTPLPETLIGAPTEHALGESFVAHKGDVVLRAKVYDTEVVTLDAPVSVAIAKFAQDIAAGTRLDPVLVPPKTTSLTGAKGRIYCGENQRTRSKFAEAMIGDMFSKYESVVRFCFVDSDDDDKLDRVFLAGAKDKADQAAVPIAPVGYTSRMFQPDDEGGELELRVHRFLPTTNKVQFKLVLTRNGEQRPFDYILTVRGGKPRETYPTFDTNPGKQPYPAYFNDLLGAGLGVMKADPVNGEVELKVHRNFPPQLFKPVQIQVQYVYIYY